MGCVGRSRPRGRRRHRRRRRPSVLCRPRAVLVAARAVRGAGDRRPLRHLRRPREPRGAERTHDRAQRRRPTCVSGAGPRDAITWLAGGPGDAATEQALAGGWQSSALRMTRDLLLVDQRGTGRSKPPHGADVTQYGTRMAMDDLDAVRAALGYRQLDVYGGSYGATAAQVYLKLYPSSVRTLILSGASALDVPFFARYAVNAQRALDQLAQFCTSQAPCRKAFPHWEAQFGELVKAWNAHPVHGMSGDQLASVVHKMLRDVNTAVSIPLVVRRCRERRLRAPRAGGFGDLDIGDLTVMGSSIWCSEPWAGLDARGPWGTDFDTYATAYIADVSKGLHPRPEARRAALALDAPHVQPGAGGRARRRRRPAGSAHEPLRPDTALLRQPHRHFPAHRARLRLGRRVRRDVGELRRASYHEGSVHERLRRRSRGAAVRTAPTKPWKPVGDKDNSVVTGPILTRPQFRAGQRRRPNGRTASTYVTSAILAVALVFQFRLRRYIRGSIGSRLCSSASSAR